MGIEKLKSFKHIEAELYAYWDTINELKQIKKDVLHSTTNEIEERKSNLLGDRGKTILLTHKKIQQLDEIVTVISSVYEQLPPEKQKLIKLKYWTKHQPLTWEGISRRVNVSRRMALYWRDEIVYMIADLLGWR